MSESLIRIFEEHRRGEKLDPIRTDAILLKASAVSGSGVELHMTRYRVGGEKSGEPYSRTYYCLNRYTVSISFGDSEIEGSVGIVDNGIEKRLTDDERLID